MNRKTSQRAAIMDVFRRTDRPLTVEAVLRDGRSAVGSLNKATVYRNLRMLLGIGWLRRVSHPELGALYERTGKDHHHHFHCRGCDRLFEIPGCALDVSGSTPPGFRTDTHDVFLYGTCASCGEAGSAHHGDGVAA
jgi:Fur family ferric uptake transcriptional regulator